MFLVWAFPDEIIFENRLDNDRRTQASYEYIIVNRIITFYNSIILQVNKINDMLILMSNRFSTVHSVCIKLISSVNNSLNLYKIYILVC